MMALMFVAVVNKHGSDDVDDIVVSQKSSLLTSIQNVSLTKQWPQLEAAH